MTKWANGAVRRFVLGAVVLVPLLAMPAGTTVAARGQGAATAQQLQSRIDAMITELQPSIVALRRDFHQHPELGFKETRTAGIVADYLRGLKFDEVRTGVAGTGVVGILKGGRPGPVVALRADMDALPIPELIDPPYKSLVPGVKHACGHDGHMAMLMGVANIFSRMRADLPGTVVFLFQPAEEGDPAGGTTGAVRVLAANGLSNPKPDAIFGLHLEPTVHVGLVTMNVGPAMAAADRFTITIQGKKTHGAMPHTGIDPIPIASEVVLALQTIPSRQIDVQQPTVLTIGSMNGGNRYNVIADSVVMEGTVRTFSKDGPAIVKAKMEQVLKGVTSSYGATYTLDYKNNAPVTYNEPALATRSRAALETAFGADRVRTSPLQMVSEDFAYYQQVIPGFYFFVGVQNPEKGITAMWHTEYYEMDEAALPIGMKAMAAVALDFLRTHKSVS
jgi:amidohydrolase